MADGISELPIITPTPEEKSAYESQFGPPPLNPIRDLTASELADLSVQDKENFELISAFRQNQDLWKDSSTVSKVAEAHNLIKQRGFSLSDLPTPAKAVSLAWDVAKGFGKQAWNYAQAVVGTPIAGMVGEITGQLPTFSEEVSRLGQRQIAENIAGTEQAITGLAETGVRAGKKLGRISGVAKPLDQFTPEEKVQDLWGAVGMGETQEEIGAGRGGFLSPVGGEVVKELESTGLPIRPEETASLAAGDPFSFWTFGKGFALAGKAVPAPIKAGIGAVGSQLATTAEKVASGTIRAGANLTQLGASAAQVVGRVAPALAAGKAILTGEPITGLAVLGGARAAAPVIRAVGRGVERGAEAAKEIGRQVGGKPVVSPVAQIAKDIAFATPGALGEIAIGTAADLGLAAVSSESPQQTESAIGVGTVLGGVGAARRIAGRVLSGQLIAPREYGVDTPVPSSGQFPNFESMHESAYNAAPPGVRARLNAVRQFVNGAGLNSDVFLAPDASTLERALVDSGIPTGIARQYAQQEGFFTTSLNGQDGNPRRVIIAKNVEAVPHESFHAFQDVLGESGNAGLDTIVRQEYGPQWDTEGTRYAQRLVGDLGNRTWEEVILDESGWGLDAAKEKIYRDIYNRMEAETGSTPTPDVVRDLADPEIVRIFNEAQNRNPKSNPSQFWREVLSPAEAKSEADRYIARELAAENFDAVFKNLGASLQPGRALPQRLARVIGNMISTLGGEPLAGRRTEIGQIEPRFAVTEQVRQSVVTPRTERAEILPVPSIRPSAPTGPEISPQAEEARLLASQAPEKPLAGGTKSPRELLGAVAEAIAQRAGIRINYLSAPGEPAAATSSNRATRRDIIETFRTMPQSARALWEKSFFPDRVVKTKTGYQILGWAPEIFAANAHKLAQALSEIPDGQNLVPYQLDSATKTFTEAAWKEIFEDTQRFVQNQLAGQTGAGQPLVIPRTVSERGFFAPASAPSRATGLDQSRADVINMLFNFRLPETPRIQPGKLPLNIAGQEVSIATTGGPQRLSVPVQPRQPFVGESAKVLGIEGRRILEVNPIRAEIEQATSKSKVAMPEFIEAVQRLNLENIKEVELAPELPQFRGNTLTLTAGFQPVAATAQDLTNFTPEQWKSVVRDYAGRLGGGLTGWAWDLGSSAKTIEDVLALQNANRQLSEAAKLISVQEPGGFDQKMSLIGRAQAAREAFEAATGQNFEGTNEGSAVPGIRKYFDPNYSPPVKLKEIKAQAQPKFENPVFETELEKIKSGESFGQTFNRDGSVWDRGNNQVDIVTLASKNIARDELTKEKVISALQPYDNLLNNPQITAGIFSFEQSGKPMVSIDVNAIVPQTFRENTVKFAKGNNQISIWDAVKSEEVKTGGSGETRLKSSEELQNALNKVVAGEPVQFQPESAEPEFKLRKPRSGFSKAWLLPTGQPVQLGGQWHHEWLDANPEIRERYGIPESAQDAGSRIDALRKGFARINYSQNGGRLVFELRAADLPKLRSSIEDFVDQNLDQIDNLRIELFDPEVKSIVNSGSSRFMDKSSDLERMQDIPFITREEGGESAVQFQPRPEDELSLPGIPVGRPVLTTRQLSEMTNSELKRHFPEAIVPQRSNQSVPSDLISAPLVKNAKDPVASYADKLVSFAREKENTPEFQLGRQWYSDFSTELKRRFGPDARIFAELLAATSPRVNVEVNFRFALDALEGFRSGRFKPQIKKFEQGLELIANNRWKTWYSRELRAGRMVNPPEQPTPAAFLAHWIESHDIKPRQSNGKLYGMNSIPVLQVAARRWLEQTKGLKVRNFVENLLGEGYEATIDTWADRTLRRLGYETFQDRWRILPQNNQAGVPEKDFKFAQAIFRKAAERMGMKPSELQAAVWFAEKQLWAENGWARLDLGDFREELKKTESLRQEIKARGEVKRETP